MATKPLWCEVVERKNGDYGFRARSGNNRIVSTSEGYTRKADAVRGAKRAHPGLQVVERAGNAWRMLFSPEPKPRRR
jgi:uncharacterized protein YegP (UPF0339 family)